MSGKTVTITCKVGLALSLTVLSLARIYMLRNTGIMTYGFWEDQAGSILIAVPPRPIVDKIDTKSIANDSPIAVWNNAKPPKISFIVLSIAATAAA